MKKSSVIAAGLALFSMFFGAGDLIWPLILGGEMGSQYSPAMMGLLVTGVSLPLLGLISMLLFKGDYRAFFNRIGKIPGFALLLVIQLVLGPVGSIPRLFTLSYATVKPYLPDISLGLFSILASILVFGFTLKKQRIIDILGLVLTPILLITLGAILFMGYIHLPDLPSNASPASGAFKRGALVGYNTLDLIASFIFAPLVLSHFQEGKGMAKKMFKASLIAAGLLSFVYIGLTSIAAYYTPHLPEHLQEERLAAISLYLLGPKGAFLSCIAVATACLTTAIPLVSIAADYVQKDLYPALAISRHHALAAIVNSCASLLTKISPPWLRRSSWISQSRLRAKERLVANTGSVKGGGRILPLIIVLSASIGFANLGFMGIADMLSPLLQILCPGLIILAILNICHKLFDLQWSKTPVYAAFAISCASYYLM